MKSQKQLRKKRRINTLISIVPDQEIPLADAVPNATLIIDDIRDTLQIRTDAAA